MRRGWRHRVEDVLHSLEKIEKYVAGFSLESFLEDRRTVDAVIRNLEIIGEAMHHIPGPVKRNYPGVPWDRLRLLRNYLAHEYFGVDDRMVWETVTRNLPNLKPAMHKVLQDSK